MAGAEHHASVLTDKDMTLLQDLADRKLAGQPATRLVDDTVLSALLDPLSTLTCLARDKLGSAARPVRAILFDKRADANWALGWHQDRTIAVRQRIDVPGFDNWSVKSGLTHVEPPFEIIENMVTLRAHLDDCDADNAPLKIIAGSHRLGRLKKPEIKELASRSEHRTCEALSGDVWIYASAIVHASGAAKVPRRRRVLHVDYSASELPHGLEWLGV